MPAWRCFPLNRSPEELWDRDRFGPSFAVSLTNYLRSDSRTVNYISSDTGGICSICDLDARQLYGRDVSDGSLIFDFDVYPDRYLGMADGIPKMGLVVRGEGSSCNDVLDLKTTVVPDSSTNGLPPDRMGPEITIRAPTFIHCALSMYESVRGDTGTLLEALDPVCRGMDWSDPSLVMSKADDIVGALNRFESLTSDLQSPVMVQAVWKTEGLTPVLSDKALDVFAWSDHALTRLFLDSVRRNRSGTVTRPVRCAVRLARLLYELGTGGKPDIFRIYSETSYGLGNDRELMVNGKTSNTYMRCARLAEPCVGSSEISQIVPSATVSLPVPERRLDHAVYYTVLGNNY